MKKSALMPLVILGIAIICLRSHTPSQAILSGHYHQPLDLQSLLLNPCLQSITAILWGISLSIINAISKSQSNKALNCNKENPTSQPEKRPSRSNILIFLSIMLFIYGFSMLFLHWNYIKDNAAPLISLLIYHAYNASSSHIDYYTWKRTITGAKEMTGIMALAVIAPILYLLTLMRTQLNMTKTL